MFMQIFVYSIIRHLVSSFIQSLHLSFIISFFFVAFRTLVTRVPSAKITQLVSLDLHSRDIDVCVLLDSRENIVKTVWVYEMTYMRFFPIFNAGMTTVL